MNVGRRRVLGGAAAASAAVLVAAGSLALARDSAERSGCGHGHPLPEKGHRYDLPRLGPLALQAGYRGDFRPGYPYKVGITRYDMS